MLKNSIWGNTIMKVWKRMTAVFALIACMAFAASALAAPAAGDTISIEKGYLTVTIPDGYYVLDQNADENYEFFQEFELDLEGMLEYLEAQNIYLDLYAKDMSHELIVMVQTPAEAGMKDSQAYDYDEIPDDYREAMLEMFDEPISVQEAEIVFGHAEFTDVKGVAWIKADAQVTDSSGGVTERLQYSTCQNGMILNVNLFVYDDSLSGVMQEKIDAVMDGIEIGVREGYVAPDITDASSGGLPTALVIVICAVIVGVIVGIAVGSRLKKKAKKSAEEIARAATRQNFSEQNGQADSPEQQEHERQ